MKRRPHSTRAAKRAPVSPKASLAVAANAAVLFLLGGGPAAAATIYWDGGSTDWAATASWSTALGATTPNPAAVPTTTDVATFSISTLTNTAQTVYLNANQSVLGLNFLGTNTATTTLLGKATGSGQGLTLGASGIVVESSAGAVTIGSATVNADRVTLTLGAAQSWTNNSANALTVLNGVTNGGFLLTVGGTGSSVLSGILAGTGGLTKSGAGTLTLSGVNTYSGTTTVSAGTLRATTSASALGAGTLALSGARWSWPTTRG